MILILLVPYHGVLCLTGLHVKVSCTFMHLFGVRAMAASGLFMLIYQDASEMSYVHVYNRWTTTVFRYITSHV